MTALLKEIRRVSLQIKMNTSAYNAMDEAKGIYYMYKQESNESNEKHLRNFKSTVNAIEHLGGEMFADKTLIENEKEEDKKNGATARDDREIRLCVREKMMAVALVKRSETENKKLIKTGTNMHLA